MYVNFSYIQNNPYIPKQRIKFDSEAFDKTFKLNVFRNVNMQYFKRMRHTKDFFQCNHYRTLPYIPMYSTYEELKSCLEKDTKLKNYFSNSVFSFSIHSAYSYNFFGVSHVEYIRDYFMKNLLLYEHMGINKFLICNHLRYAKQAEAMQIIAYLLTSVPRLTDAFCLENCEYFSDALDCLFFCESLGIPFIFDNLHNRINGEYKLCTLSKRITDTWSKHNNHVFAHYSEGDATGKHGDKIVIEDLIEMIAAFKPYTDNLTIMIEVKNAKQALNNFRIITQKRLNWSSWNQVTF